MPKKYINGIEKNVISRHLKLQQQEKNQKTWRVNSIAQRKWQTPNSKHFLAKLQPQTRKTEKSLLLETMFKKLKAVI